MVQIAVKFKASKKAYLEYDYERLSAKIKNRKRIQCYKIAEF